MKKMNLLWAACLALAMQGSALAAEPVQQVGNPSPEVVAANQAAPKTQTKVKLSDRLRALANSSYREAEEVDFSDSAKLEAMEKRKETVNRPLPDKLNLTWQPFVTPETNLSVLPKVEGLEIVSPTWFDIVTAKGEIKSKASRAYMNGVLERGYKIWPLITNSFKPDMTHELLANKKAKERVIREMGDYAREFKLSGYNLDFENIRDDDKDRLTAFVKEITETMHKQGVLVSMDITIQSGEPFWSNCYDRKALGETLDYVMLMAYDEYTPSGHIPGSTASLNWVERGVKQTLRHIPAEKLLLGVPFYSRLWSRELATGKVTGQTLSMKGAKNIIAMNGLKGIWEEGTGQYFYTYGDDKVQKLFWQEEERSIGLKADLVKKYNLAGVASWRYGFESPEVWPVLAEKLANK